MSAEPVELRVGGQVYRVVASASEEELRRLAAVVEARLRQVTPPGRQISPHSLLLAALSLAHDLEEERSRTAKLAARSREMLGSILTRIDAAIGTSASPNEASEAPPT
ncbi:MAG TPA: cell division protein ZapA [Polyangiaceae bacterium]